MLALDANRQARPTGQITVKAYPLLVIPIASALISQITCNTASSCRLTVSMATLAAGGGTATGTGNIAIEAFADDLPNQGGVAPAAASARVAPRGLDITRTSGSRPIMVSVPLTGGPTQGFDIVPRNQTLDVAFHAGTGLDLTRPAQATFFSDFVGNAHQLFFGGDAAVGDTMTMTPAGAAATAFWLSKTPAIVGIRGSGTQGNLCDRQFVDYVSFAETQAVIHNVNCRDNADAGGGTFSALIGSGSVGSTRILWHEFHHAVYDLADEYPPDGGYFQTADLPNVMNGPNECTLRGAEPSLCASIGTTGWWRSGPANDVMIGNTQENLDDRRRATFIINKCKAAQC
ncbi:M64 family metallopeptidase [Polaromonas sp. P1(28)-8]|nr:M64 family metallopeptidase [Polaromonas sp. P1(28)-8]